MAEKLTYDEVQTNKMNWSRVNDIQNILHDVSIQDQTSEIVDYYFCNITDTTTPSSTVSVDTNTITVDDATGATVGDCINISEDGRTFQAKILSVTGSNIVFNAPADQAFTTSAEVCFGIFDLSRATGTFANPIIYKVCPPVGADWDITRVIFDIVDDGTFTSTTFGAIAGGLTNGIVLRVKDGCKKNIFTIQNNAEFRERAYDVDIVTSGFFGTGQNGLVCRRTFAGQSKNGVTIRLNSSDECELEIIVQDDLTDLIRMSVVAQGHVVE